MSLCLTAVLALVSLHMPSGVAFAEEPWPYEVMPVEVDNFAALAARILRGDETGAEYRIWRTTLAHAPETDALFKVARNMLTAACGYTITAPQIAPLLLVPCSEVPLPADDIELNFGEDFNLHGTVYSDAPLASVAVTVTHKASDSSIYPYKKVATFSEADNVTAYSLDSSSNIENASLSMRVHFSEFRLGRHKIEITARTVTGETLELYHGDFTIKKLRPRMLTQNSFNDNFSRTFDFFGRDASKFLFSFSWRDDRNIATNDKWRMASLVECSLEDRVHVQALPYFEHAASLLESSYVRLAGDGRDSGVIQLVKLIENFSTYTPRFTNSKRYISHHTLGTCSDVNGYMYPNKDILSNHELLGDEVRNKLVYNGIKTEDGQPYYDFTYSGDYPARYKNVPTTLLNYLLYELAFYRAGFGWGFYYETSCDGMHFTLTDTASYWKHSDPRYGVRKVYDYYN